MRSAPHHRVPHHYWMTPSGGLLGTEFVLSVISSGGQRSERSAPSIIPQSAPVPRMHRLASLPDVAPLLIVFVLIYAHTKRCQMYHRVIDSDDDIVSRRLTLVCFSAQLIRHFVDNHDGRTHSHHQINCL